MTGRIRVQFGLIGLATGLALSLAVPTEWTGTVAAAGRDLSVVQQSTAQSTPPPAQGRGAAPTANPRGGGPGGSVGSGRMGGGRGGPGGSREWEWWKDDAAKRELGLTDKVAADIDGYYQNRMRAITPFVDELRKQSDVLNQMTVERKVEESIYAVQVSHVEALLSKLRESRAMMLYHIYMKLSPEQYKKLEDVSDRHFQRGRGGQSR